MRSKRRRIRTRRHEVGEHPVGDPVARLDALNFVEFPVDAEINPALAVFFGCLTEAVKGARHQGSRLAILINGNVLDLIGVNGKRKFARPELFFIVSKKAAADPAWPERIGGEGGVK